MKLLLKKTIISLFFFIYISSAIGGDKKDKEYIVKINGIEITDNSAMNILSHIEGKEKGRKVKMTDNSNGESIGAESLASMVEPGINIEIHNSETLIDVLEVFEKYPFDQNILDKDIEMISNDNGKQRGFEFKRNIYLCVKGVFTELCQFK